MWKKSKTFNPLFGSSSIYAQIVVPHVVSLNDTHPSSQEGVQVTSTICFLHNWAKSQAEIWTFYSFRKPATHCLKNKQKVSFELSNYPKSLKWPQIALTIWNKLCHGKFELSVFDLKRTLKSLKPTICFIFMIVKLCSRELRSGVNECHEISVERWFVLIADLKTFKN